MIRALFVLTMVVMTLTVTNVGAFAATVAKRIMTPEYVTTNQRLIQRYTEEDAYLASLDLGTQHQVLCMALNMYHEARGSSVDDQIMIGHIVLNRTGDGRWRPSACEVVWQQSRKGAQFSWTKDGRSDMPHEPAAWTRAKAVAYNVWFGLYDDVSDGRTHYYAININKKPKWDAMATDKIEIGKHVFMKV